MKKYLMTGMAALALCAAFTSCSKGEDLYDENLIEKNGVEKIKADYEAAFIATFGQPAPNQDWGFGSTQASTRAENKNLNQWGDPAQNGGKAWDVPPALTDEQKLRVRLYFQYNPRLTYIAPTYTDFFVQQVYKGNPNTAGPNSAEEYYRVNTEKFTGSDEMDYLFCATETTHINDFNNGEWNNGTALPVLDTGANTNDYKGDHEIKGVSHLDQITLMVNSSAAYIGYGVSSDEAAKRYDCCALAGAKAIDDWVASDEAKALNLLDYGAPVYDSKWNRSFVGLDYEAMKKADALSNTSVKALDFKEDGISHVLYNNTLTKIENFSDFVLTDKDGNEVKYLNDNVSNEAVGQKMKVGDNFVTKSTFNKKENKSDLEALYGHIDGNSEIRYLDLNLVMTYINDGCNPTSSDKNMVKNIGGRDYVYSDWIVTLTEAKKVGDDTPKFIRIIAEDLSVGQGSEDFDFNDVVIDVYYGDAGKAKAKILAAGGTLPLTVDGKEVHKEFSKANNNIDCDGKMINTNGTQSADPNVRSRSLDNLEVPEIPLTNEVKTLAQARDNIAIKVLKEVNGKEEWVTLEAVIGKVASKVRVGNDYNWKDEREYVGDGFKAFVEGTASWDEWYQNQQ